MNFIKCIRRGETVFCSTCSVAHSEFNHSIRCMDDADGITSKIIVTCVRCGSLVYRGETWNKITTVNLLVSKLEVFQDFQTGSCIANIFKGIEKK